MGSYVAILPVSFLLFFYANICVNELYKLNKGSDPMSQFTSYGYSKMREYVRSTFTYVGVGNGAGEVLRLNNTTITINGDTVSYTFQVTNVDNTLMNKTINNAKIYESSSAVNAVAEVNFTDFKFESTDDVLTLTINIQLPSIV